MDPKHPIRAETRALRSALDAEERAHGGRAVAERALGLPDLAHAGTVLGYWPTDEELDARPLLDRLSRLGARIALPRIDEPGRLTLHLHTAASDLVEGSFGILEPRADAPRVSPPDIDAVLVPGVAFDLRGHRLGYGGGFYDRLLGLLRPDAYTVGLAFECQVLGEALPAEVHDVALRALVTPARTLLFA